MPRMYITEYKSVKLRIYSLTWRKGDSMARNFMYVYERIYIEQNDMQAEFRKIPIKGKRTSAADVKRVRSIISDSNYKVAQEC